MDQLKERQSLVTRVYATGNMSNIRKLVKANASDEKLFAELSYLGVTQTSIWRRWAGVHSAKQPGIGFVEVARFGSESKEMNEMRGWAAEYSMLYYKKSQLPNLIDEWSPGPTGRQYERKRVGEATRLATKVLFRKEIKAAIVSAFRSLAFNVVEMLVCNHQFSDGRLCKKEYSHMKHLRAHYNKEHIPKKA